MHPIAAWFFAALCSWGIWEFGSLLWRMLKTRQFEDSNGEIIKANEHPANFRLSVYVGAALVIGIVVAAIYSWKQVIENLLG